MILVHFDEQDFKICLREIYFFFSLVCVSPYYIIFPSLVISTPTPNNPALRTVATPGVDYYIAFITPEEIKFGRDQTTHTFKIQIVNDEEPEIDEYFEVKLSEMDCPVLGDAAITVRIQDDDSKCFESYVV